MRTPFGTSLKRKMDSRRRHRPRGSTRPFEALRAEPWRERSEDERTSEPGMMIVDCNEIVMRLS
jgi:hypothetical protein